MSPWIEAAAAVLHSVVQNYLSSTGLFNRHCWTVMSSWQFNCLWIETSAAPVALSDWRKVNDDQVSNSFRISIQHYYGGGKRQTFLSPFPFASEKSGFAFCFLSSQKAEQKGGGVQPFPPFQLGLLPFCPLPKRVTVVTFDLSCLVCLCLSLLKWFAVGWNI